MDGVQGPVKPSLQRRLSLWLSAIIVAVAVAAGGFAFVSAFSEAHELQDDVLRQVGAMFDPQHLPAASAEAPMADQESRVVVQLLPAPGADAGRASTRATPVFPSTLADGMQTARAGKYDYRVWVRTLADGQRIAVAQETAVRNETARNSALHTVMPFLILVPILLLAMADVLRKMFAPIRRLAHEVDQRDERQLHAIAPDAVPAEVRPFVVAINRLLARVAQSVQAQHRFVADAAHELRTPLTALSLQAERLGEAPMSAAAQERLAALRQGIERSRALLEQLLTLARAQADTQAPAGAVSVQRVFRSVLEDLMPLAEAKRLDLGVTTDADARVRAGELDLFVILRNLVDNAIRYTPDGGSIDLSLQTDGGLAHITVQDTGPGIPASERARVFDAFYRVLGNGATGSGLGLSIVGTLVQRLGGEVALDEAAGTASGLRATVRLPLAG
ncbi:ATP-binding protein [Ralstonia pseudosolanacearum]|uniref:histidine kinase n=1 Tax=Ralstonia solanacearum TaxID=305 RepID=A0A0S4WM47_RALSL|nr:ATP-binding protein [Ralstonia pseudosolanacearum]APC70102.1 two-component sensor histidine kinase [Ralstonia solanacearum OE1-1]OIN70636.1 two-component sensor histidine kinase [Ralstonia solanacearum]API73106.1 two-component sensor histidine kinase [Ralstonia pseudosolanacearum]MDO3558067.1 ATP-binding protein [Ralstonia pseudosolanacearum]MDO3577443.1 ATP-binding protein [Ralstonia pseudosolanacearum]